MSISRLKEVKQELERKLSELDENSPSYQVLEQKIEDLSKTIDLITIYLESDTRGISTATMIQEIKVGQIAQCMNYPRRNELDLSPAYNNAYCVKKYKDGSIRWLSGMKRSLRITPFAGGKARWMLQNKEETY